MIHLQHYTLVERLWESPRILVYRGYRDADGAPVVGKVLRGEYPDTRDIAALDHEYRILRELDDEGVIAALGIEPFNRGLALILEDLQGRALSELCASGALDLERSLQIGAQLARTLERLHARSILHKDIKPHNIVCNLATGQCKLVDFGIATRLGQEPQRGGAAQGTLEGTLAYMSPEQTGRTNRDIDHRSDLYALGVTLYEMLTGQLPFQTTDAAELVHAHLARVPDPPRMRAPAVPEVVSALVMKLLSKEPEERYQSARGLADDLAACVDRLRAHGVIAPFALGQRDVSDVLRVPRKLYGREPEVAALHAALERSCGVNRRSELLLVSGAAGIGKSALVRELEGAVARRGGEFIAGKFDQLHRDKAFGPFTHAFRQLVGQLLAEPPARLAAWREEILATVGPSGRILTELVPELELVIGPQPAIPPAGSAESQHRFSTVIRAFVRLFCAPTRPLILFLDDLQWADPASLSLLQSLLIDPDGGHLLIAGAYREQEVEEGHPLRSTLEELRKAGVTPSEIALAPLDLPGLRRLLGDALGGAADERVGALAAHVFAKTHGNPFFITQLLLAWHKAGLLRLDRAAARWTWDDAAIAAAPVADNVVDFVAGRLKDLAPGTQHLLSLGACIGHELRLLTLSTIAEQPAAGVAAALWPALREGLMIPIGTDYRLLSPSASEALPGAALASELDVRYRFLHDRVQQAAYSLMESSEQEAVHLLIGRRLRQALGDAPHADDLFEVVHHLNLGAPRMDEPGERAALARLDLAAGRTARSATAYAAAAGYFDAGIALLGAAWDDDHDLLFALHLEKAECDFVAREHQAVLSRTEMLLQRARSRIDRARVAWLNISVYAMQGRYQHAIDAGRRWLRLCGVEVPETPEALRTSFLDEVAAIDAILADRSIESLAGGPTAGAEQEAVARMLAQFSGIAVNVDPLIVSFGFALAVKLSLTDGRSASSSYSQVNYALVITGLLGRYAEAQRWGQLALASLEERRITEGMCSVRWGLAHFTPFIAPLRDGLEHFMQAQKAEAFAGDLVFRAMAFAGAPVTQLRMGVPLDEVSLGVQRGLVTAKWHPVSTAQLTGLRQIIACLQGRTHGRTSCDDDDFDTAAWLTEIDAKGLFAAKFLHAVGRMLLSLLYEDHPSALRALEEAAQVEGRILGFHWTTDLPFYGALAVAAATTGAAEADKPRLMAMLEQHRTKIARLADACPPNELHREALVSAEAARIAGRDLEAMDLYEQAIRHAREGGFTHVEALANELCARFHVARGRARVGRVYLLDAHYAYKRWGASAKVAQLEEAYGDLLPQDAPSLAGSGSDGGAAVVTTGTRGTRRVSAAQLDVASLVEAAQAISGEIVLDKLLARLMTILCKNAGAQRGALLLGGADSLAIEATLTVDPDVMTIGPSRPLEGSRALAASIARYVARTRESVVLSAPGQDPRFADDPYLAEHQPRSLLCAPLVHQGRLTGVMYLENNVVRDAFSPARVEVVSLLSSQAAIAIENARLYGDLESRVRERTEEVRAANEQLRVELAERTRLQREHAQMHEAIIEAQQSRLRELSTPVIPITDRVLIMPLIGTLDEARARQMVEVALESVRASQVSIMIIDVTGVKGVDADVAGTLMRVASALRLLGTQAVITGIQPAVARTLVYLDVNMGSLETRGSLKTGIAYALKQTGGR